MIIILARRLLELRALYDGDIYRYNSHCLCVSSTHQPPHKIWKLVQYFGSACTTNLVLKSLTVHTAPTSQAFHFFPWQMFGIFLFPGRLWQTHHLCLELWMLLLCVGWNQIILNQEEALWSAAVISAVLQLPQFDTHHSSPSHSTPWLSSLKSIQ